MIQIIEVLRFHYLEIEKVHELCDNFCERYIHLLKSKFAEDINVQHEMTKSEEESFLGYDDNSISSIKSQENFDSDLCEENDEVCQSRQKKRGMFPKSATSIMRTWLFQHLTVRILIYLFIGIFVLLYFSNFIFSIHIHLKMKRNFLLKKLISIYYKLIIGRLIIA